MLLQYKYQDHSRCPRCNVENETVTHVLQCPAPLAKSTWNKAIEDLQKWALDQKGCPEMINIIISSIQSWQSITPYHTFHPQNTTLQQAIKQQDNIGWQNFIEGFWSKKWRTYLEDYFLLKRIQKSALVWMVNLQHQLWNIMRIMWDHRNATLHNDGTTLHQYEMNAINEEIIAEFDKGLANLPHTRYSYLFQGTVQDRLHENLHQKRMWLGSVWTARDRVGETGTRQRSATALAFFERWKARVGK